jgi:hypothetical protein
MIVIGIAGYAKAGKDTFVSIAKTILTRNDYRPIRIAFADKLKDEVQGMLYDNRFKLDVKKLTPEEKERVRPLFVFWGCQRRYESDGGLYWVDVVQEWLEDIAYECKQEGESDERIVALVSDVRFPNESKWIHETWNGQVIHLRRYKKVPIGVGVDEKGCMMTTSYNHEYDPAPNEEEFKQDPLVLAQADYRVEWENKGAKSSEEAAKDPELHEIVLKALNALPVFNGKLI